MNRQLILMRHAKSDWSSEGMADHDRSLNERGKRDAPDMADWLVEKKHTPDKVLCSSATRTRQTLRMMLKAFKPEPQIQFDEMLYLASPGTIAEVIAANGADARNLMVIAHNPGMSLLVSELAGEERDMPTAAIAIFEISIDHWHQFDLRSPAEMTHLMRPKGL